MMDLQTILSSISGGDPAGYRAASDRWDSLAKPLGSLGELETAIVRIAAPHSPDRSRNPFSHAFCKGKPLFKLSVTF